MDGETIGNKMITQQQIQQQQQQKISNMNRLFVEMVQDGMTRNDLENCIKLRPQLWGRFSHWMSILPEGKQK
ncbi:MAG: hypothetical protein FGM61_04470 [Sediminibacterium sp.]|nr:hypothetical protein [Sediminibacterium sp.]